MASATKTQPATARRKSSKGSMIITLKLSPKALQRFEDKPIKESPSKDSSSIPSNAIPVAASSHGDNPSESIADTSAASGTPGPSSMPPPSEGVKKKGVKRSSGALTLDGLPKVRGKPGPKKKARLEDGTIDHSSSTPKAVNGTVAHKLGPKANQGAINAGLRALDRSGKPCRKWQKGAFKLKSFTGVVWEIPRWKAPPKVTVEDTSVSGDSSKENKDNSQMESERSNSGVDVEMGSTASAMASSPAPSNPTATPAPPVPETSPMVASTA